MKSLTNNRDAMSALDALIAANQSVILPRTDVPTGWRIVQAANAPSHRSIEALLSASNDLGVVPWRVTNDPKCVNGLIAANDNTNAAQSIADAAKLQALQSQQVFAIHALDRSNTTAQNILILFR